MNKPKHRLCGRILVPVHTGMRAILDTEEGAMMTSRVVRIKKSNNRKIIFETENSVYEIFLTERTATKAA